MIFITNIPDTERIVIEFLDVGNQLYLKRLSKRHYHMITNMKHLQYYIKSKVYPIPRQLTSNKQFLTTHTIIGYSYYHYFEEICKHGDYDTLVWFMGINGDELPTYVHYCDVNRELLYHIVKNTIINKQTRMFKQAICDKQHKSLLNKMNMEGNKCDFDPHNCGRCNKAFDNIITSCDLRVIQLLEFHCFDQFFDVMCFLKLLNNKDIQVIFYLFAKYRSYYEYQLMFESVKNEFIDILNKSIYFCEMNKTLLFGLHGIIVSGVDVNTLLQLCMWLRRLTDVAKYDEVLEKFISKKYTSYSIISNYTPYQVFIAAIRQKDIGNAQRAYAFITEVTHDLIWESCCYMDGDISEKKFTQMLDWILMIMKRHNFPINYTNDRYTYHAIINHRTTTAKWLVDHGFALCPIDDELLEDIVHSVDLCTWTESYDRLSRTYEFLFPYIPDNYAFPEFIITISEIMLTSRLCDFLKSHNRSYCDDLNLDDIPVLSFKE